MMADCVRNGLYREGQGFTQESGRKPLHQKINYMDYGNYCKI